jgi:hypothetical protein
MKFIVFVLLLVYAEAGWVSEQNPILKLEFSNGIVVPINESTFDYMSPPSTELIEAQAIGNIYSLDP